MPYSSDSTDSWSVRAPRRMAPWIPIAILAGVLWLAAIEIAFDTRHGTPHEVFAGCMAAAVVASIIAAIVGIGTGLARNQVAMSKKLDQVATDQRQLFTALGENTGAFQQLSARVAQFTDPERVDWPSYTAGAADALGVDQTKVLQLPVNGGRPRRA
jgi:hypothetical protein